VRIAIKALYRPEDIIEVRAWDKNHKVYTGRYKYGKLLVRIIELFDGEGCDVYTVLNPVSDKLGFRDMAEGGLCTWEQDIPWRRWFLLDFDPRRDHKIATDGQFGAALEAARRAKEWLEACGWAGIVMASSGNGVHLDVPCDLPNDSASKELVRKIQRIVATEFSNQDVEIECFPDANRLVRAYGTVNKKGMETELLKYRQSGILEVGNGVCDARAIIGRIIAGNPIPDPREKKPSGGGKGPFTRDALEARLTAWEEGWEGPDEEKFTFEECDRQDGFRVWCPGNFPDGWPDGEAHGDVYDSLNDSTIVWVENGWPRFSCRHAHCSEGAEHGKKTWLDLQNYYDPGRRLHRIADEDDSIPAWDLGFVDDGSAEVGEAEMVEIMEPMIADNPRTPNPGVWQAVEPDEDEVSTEQARIAAYQPAQKEPGAKKLHRMPESSMWGWLGRKARELDTPLGFAYPAMLTAFASLLNTCPKQVRPTLYTCLTGPVHCGKSETIRRALASLKIPDPETVKWTVPGSDRGLITK
jgi:hypothetical protein